MPAIYKNGLLYAGTSSGSGANTDIIADEYTEKAYAVGDYCIHEDALYKCNTAITVAESWTAAHWTEKDIATELKAINNTISTLGTASTKNVAVSGDASSTEVVMGDDTRLTDSRSANDVYSWAKASNKPSYTASEVGAASSSHTHGNIQNSGTLQTNDITIASGDKLVVTDSSNSNKVARTSISFDGSTDTKCLTQKGTWETFANGSNTVTSVKVGTTSYTPSSGVVSLPAYPTTLPASDTTSTYSSTGTVPVNGTAVASAISGKMNTSNPSGTGTFSMNRKANTTVGNYSTTEGYNCTASGSYSHAEGESTTAAGRYGSHAEGLGAEASGDSSHAEGGSTTASGECSHAEGGSTTAGARYSHAEGNSTTANAEDAHAEGLGCTASGLVSHAEGGYTTSSGSYSHVEGYYTTAQRKSQHVFGEYNVLDTTGDTTTKGNYVEIVGNGTGTNARSNARTLDWSGNEWIAGNYKSDALTASKLLVSDANKNITSSSLAESDLITTSNIGSQAVLSATQASQSSYSDFLHSYNQSGVIYSNNEYLFRSRYNVKSDGRFYLEIYNNNNDTTTYDVRVDYATSAANAIKWNNVTYDMNTANTTDTWIPVLSNGKFQHTLRDLKNATSYIDWNNTATREYLATLRTLIFWNGAYASGGNSNLQYCDRGRFGTIVTKASDDVVLTYTDGTFYKAAHLVTFKGSDNALVGGGKGNYVWGISSWSDSRLKENIKDSKINALDIINKVKMHEFDFIDEKYGEHKNIGYVAQELKEIIPECVIDVPISEEEQEKYNSETLMQVEDKHLIKYLVKAVQELSQKVEEQQQEINELKGGDHI